MVHFLSQFIFLLEQVQVARVKAQVILQHLLEHDASAHVHTVTQGSSADGYRYVFANIATIG